MLIEGPSAKASVFTVLFSVMVRIRDGSAAALKVFWFAL